MSDILKTISKNDHPNCHNVTARRLKDMIFFFFFFFFFFFLRGVGVRGLRKKKYERTNLRKKRGKTHPKKPIRYNLLLKALMQEM